MTPELHQQQLDMNTLLRRAEAAEAKAAMWEAEYREEHRRYWEAEARAAELERENAWLHGIIYEHVGTDAPNVDPEGWEALEARREASESGAIRAPQYEPGRGPTHKDGPPPDSEEVDEHGLCPVCQAGRFEDTVLHAPDCPVGARREAGEQ